MSMRPPKYRLHRARGLAVVTLSGRDFYLGKYGTAESRSEYDRLCAEWLSNGRSLAPVAGPDRDGDRTIDELIVGYLSFVDGHYVKNGKPTTDPVNIRLALKALRNYGHTRVRDFGPLALKAIRDQMIREPNNRIGAKSPQPLCRTEINKRIWRIVGLFRWGVENELTPPTVHQALKAVASLSPGRSEARESKPVRPVSEADVDALEAHVAPQIWAMIQLQRLTGARPGEICQLRRRDIDTSGAVWTYVPESHKTERHGHKRQIYLGPRAQTVLRPWLRADLDAHLFSPTEAMEWKRAKMRSKRKTPVQPSQQKRRKRRPRKGPGDCYTADSYRRAITYGCSRAKVPHWHPHQLRHNSATWLRKQFGIEVAQIILGHASLEVTQRYAEVDREKALTVMAHVG